MKSETPAPSDFRRDDGMTAAPIPPKEVILTLLRYPGLRSILAICLILAVLLPIYSTLFIMPQFAEQLANNFEDDALRTARNLASHLPQTAEPLARQHITDRFLADLKQARLDFELVDIRIFDAHGAVIFSTKSKELGHVNTKEYFKNRVAKGKVYTKISAREERSAEGEALTCDVAEVYVPLMAGSAFRGAFEIYYDVTREKRAMDRLLFRSSLLLYTISLFTLLLSGYSLYKASSALIQRNRAKQLLQEANQSLKAQVAEQTHEIQVTQRISIGALASLAEFYDSETGEHLLRIQEYTELLVSYLKDHSGYSAYIHEKADYIADIKLASLLHDVGKTAIPKDVLLKPGKLSREETELVKQHTVFAGEVLLKANKVFVDSFGKDSYLALAREIATHHHERWDGKGYPDGLAGKAIPLSARIIALVDVYDALRTRRPYKEAWSHRDTIQEIVRQKGKQFDPDLVEAFLAIEKQFEWVSSCYMAG